MHVKSLKVRQELKNKPSRGGVARLGILFGLLGAGIGFGAALFVLPTPSPDWVLDPSVAEVVDVAPQAYIDTRSVPVTVTTSPSWEAKSGASGVFRASSCKAGEVLQSGQAPFEIANNKIVLLHLAQPPWRDLEKGAKGSDVTDLQQELKRLGYLEAEPNGIYGDATAQAVARMWKAVGQSAKQTTLPLSQVIWIPEPELTVTDCAAEVGSQAEQSATLFTSGGGITQLEYVPSPQWLDGTRQAVLQDTTAVLDDSGTITDPEFLNEFENGGAYQMSLTDPNRELSIETQLAQPLTVLGVPASALYEVTGPQACVLTPAGPAAVQIVASQFGVTMVQSETAVTQVTANPAKDATSCR